MSFAIFDALQRFLGLGSHRLMKKLRRNGVRPDIVLPGHIAIDMGQMMLFNIDREVGIRFSETTDLQVRNLGEEGFMDNYVLSLETSRYDMPRLDWRISNSRPEAEQAARIIGDVLSGALLSADSERLPRSTKALAHGFGLIPAS